MHPPLQRPIRRLLVANRGEIATRIIASARELSILTYAIYISGDASHATRANHAIKLPSAAAFMDIDKLIAIVKEHGIDAVHPGYGFLSESAQFARIMWSEAEAMVVGPGWHVLEKTGDKLKARALAEECRIPVCPALEAPTDRVSDVEHFASQVGYPVMLKAVDGGGGRGIRLVRSHSELSLLLKRAVQESPSKQVFAEKAAVDGFRHVEVQIIGDGKGGVKHLWERECSIQRRYQKMVELAPSTVRDRSLISRVIDDAVRMAQHITYFSLGTFEFLLNPHTQEYYFLEINPRLQVEHTITECVSGTDILRAQLLLAQGAAISSIELPLASDPMVPPPLRSIQLRITAEDPKANFSLSIGKIKSFKFPTGNGIRVDTHLTHEQVAVVSADFDSLLAKLIVTAPSYASCMQKALRALDDTQIEGVKTNLDILRAIISHPDFASQNYDTQWLEAKQSSLLANSQRLSGPLPSPVLAEDSAASSSQSFSIGAATTNTLFRKGDAWSLTLSPESSLQTSSNDMQQLPPTHHLQLTRIHRNEFPASLSASLLFTTSSQPPTPYHLTLAATSSSAATSISGHRRADPTDPSHIGIPFAGKLVEVLVDPGDRINQGSVVAVVQQMKMELEVRSARSGHVAWVTDLEDGEEVAEGMLVAIVELEQGSKL